MENCKRCKSEEILEETSNQFYNVYTCLSCKYVTTERIDQCCRSSSKVITIESRTDSLIKIYHQCINCGGANKQKPLSSRAFFNKIRTSFSETNFINWKEKVVQENKQLWAWISKNNEETSHYTKYLQYLQSKKWKAIRIEVLIRDKNTCQECKGKPADDIHHKTYENLYNEPLDDLIAMCKSCHIEIHRKIDTQKKS